ncbi:hypothetical protein KQX54_002358 [Cotesia glomerata]|uniref:Uncharacterized protein n=1 Tax=Cotesia glomerata TaxID=32391 RepID=A0AAV7IAN2_COTGL|nr:hypothetical protein KQX54_002358 [Cotesia glomerata]
MENKNTVGQCTNTKCIRTPEKKLTKGRNVKNCKYKKLKRLDERSTRIQSRRKRIRTVVAGPAAGVGLAIEAGPVAGVGPIIEAGPAARVGPAIKVGPVAGVGPGIEAGLADPAVGVGPAIEAGPAAAVPIVAVVAVPTPGKSIFCPSECIAGKSGVPATDAEHRTGYPDAYKMPGGREGVSKVLERKKDLTQHTKTL